jgi:hypothetical protein
MLYSITKEAVIYLDLLYTSDYIYSYIQLLLEHLCLYMMIIIQNRSDLVKDLLLLAEDYSELEYFLRRN